MTDLAPQAISTISIFLTLISLLGTFFYVQLSNWLRDLLALRAKQRLNAGLNTDDARRALRECRYSLPGLLNLVPLVMSVAISGFIGYVAWNAFAILASTSNSDVALRIGSVFTVFLWIYGVLVALLLLIGYALAFQIKCALDA